MKTLKIENKEEVVAAIKEKVDQLNELCDIARDNELDIRIAVERTSLKGGERTVECNLDITKTASVKLVSVVYHGNLYNID